MEKKTIPALDPVTASYLAGFWDGEGTITIIRKYRQSGKPTYEEYMLCVTVSQKKPEVIEWIRELFGCGSMSKHTARSSWGECVMTRWNAVENIAYQVCMALLPYLRIKRRQAELAIEFHEYKLSLGSRFAKGYKGTMPTPADRLDRYRNACIEMRALNGNSRAMSTHRLKVDAALAMHEEQAISRSQR